MPAVNGHILFPDPPDWSVRPEWQREWENEVTTGVHGGESRRALRAQPLAKVTFSLTTTDLVATARLDDLLMAAKKSGLACAPQPGRGGSIATASGTTVTLARVNWPWAVGDYLFLRTAGGSFETAKITAVSGTVLTLAAALTGTYFAGDGIWPLIFGKFTSDPLELITPQLARLKLTLTEQVAARTATIGTTETADPDNWFLG